MDRKEITTDGASQSVLVFTEAHPFTKKGEWRSGTPSTSVLTHELQGIVVVLISALRPGGSSLHHVLATFWGKW